MSGALNLHLVTWLLILVNIKFWSQVCTKFKLIVSTAIIISTWQVTIIIVKNIKKFVGFNYHVYLLTVFHRLDALIMRFETPDSRNKWDSPLFVIQVHNSFTSTSLKTSA